MAPVGQRADSSAGLLTHGAWLVLAVDRAEADPEGVAAARRARASVAGQARSRTRRPTAAQKRMLQEELQELDRLDREMRGEIRPRKMRQAPFVERPKASKQVKAMVEQTQEIWDQIYSEVGRRAASKQTGRQAGRREERGQGGGGGLTGWCVCVCCWCCRAMACPPRCCKC